MTDPVTSRPDNPNAAQPVDPKTGQPLTNQDPYNNPQPGQTPAGNPPAEGNPPADPNQPVQPSGQPGSTDTGSQGNKNQQPAANPDNSQAAIQRAREAEENTKAENAQLKQKLEKATEGMSEEDKAAFMNLNNAVDEALMAYPNVKQAIADGFFNRESFQGDPVSIMGQVRNANAMLDNADKRAQAKLEANQGNPSDPNAQNAPSVPGGAPANPPTPSAPSDPGAGANPSAANPQPVGQVPENFKDMPTEEQEKWLADNNVQV